MKPSFPGKAAFLLLLAPSLFLVPPAGAAAPPGEAEIARQIARLEAGNFIDRVQAGQRLARLGAPAVPALLQLLGRPPGGARFSAVLVLGQIGDRRAGPALHDLFRDQANPSRERSAAALALGRLEYAPAGPALIEALDEDSTGIQSVSALALGMIGDDGAVPRLARLARSESEQVSRSAQRALESIGDRALPRLEEILAGEAHGEKLLALEALKHIDTQKSVAVLERALAGENEYLRLTAAFLLSELGNPAGRETALAALEAADPKVRAMALRVLSNLDALPE